MSTNDIPLHCSICPRRPNFSDVSHLLTHIASKGHLSNYYKVKVRSTSEEASRRLIESYDRWYAEWNVEELMSERMAQKDKRRSRARPTGMPFTCHWEETMYSFHLALARPAATPRLQAPVPRLTRLRNSVGTLLDPRLSEQQIKVETSVTPTSTSQSDPVLRQRPPRAFGSHIQFWRGDSRASSHSYTNPDFETSSEYSDPSESRQYYHTIEDSCAIEDDPTEAIPVDPMAVSESTKLKGVYWPGMDIFDSATPEMRRKRNQKKDNSVVEQLELNSQEVEPTELIFTPQGSFKRQRRISSSVYDDEEEDAVKSESPIPALARPMLVSRDVNVPRRSHHLTRPRPRYVARSSYEEEPSQVDFESDYINHAPKRKRAFDVFQDEDVSFGQPAMFSFLTAGFQPQPSPSPLPVMPSYKVVNNPFHFENKENTAPALHPSAYEHHHPHQPIGYHYHTYAYGLGQDHQYNNHLFMHGYQHSQEDDDQRTITAPPSPSTS